MKVLVVGSGAREHNITWKLSQSKKIDKLFAAPGNAGMKTIAEIADINAVDTGAMLKFARENRIDLTVVGPEQPLAAGIVDVFQKAGMSVFGPTQKAAEIESSKVFSGALLEKHGIPSAKNVAFTDFKKAGEYLNKQTAPIVLKADGLASGKGVIIAETLKDAQQALADMMQNRSFGKSGESVVIQEYLTGREMSFFVFTDSKTVRPTVPACDYKRIFDGNKGPNTGGMGSYSPPEFYTPILGDIIMKTIMKPTVMAMADEGRSFTGTLYGGLFITPSKTPKVIEFNCRLGDPETQVVLPRMKTDLLDVILAILDNRLDKTNIEFDDNAAVGVVMASGGYPGSYKTGFPIKGLGDVDKDIMVFHAGTKSGPNGEVLTSGGRVLTVVAKGKDIKDAREKVYKNISRISFEGAYYRKDIADFK
jgi:phosphoribosylamine---glycine ligase